VESPVLRMEVSSTSVRTEFSMSHTTTVSPLRQRMIEDMAARKLNPHTQCSHISSCKWLAAWLKRSPDTATPDEVRLSCRVDHNQSDSIIINLLPRGLVRRCQQIWIRWIIMTFSTRIGISRSLI
jgi:hypothetical protein